MTFYGLRRLSESEGKGRDARSGYPFAGSEESVSAWRFGGLFNLLRRGFAGTLCFWSSAHMGGMQRCITWRLAMAYMDRFSKADSEY